MKNLPFYLGCAPLGAIVAGFYGIVHDQVTFTLSPEYFTRFKFQQFADVNPGLGDRAFVAIIGVLATWWVGLIGGYILARTAVRRDGTRLPTRQVLLAFGIMLGGSLLCALAGYAYAAAQSADAIEQAWEWWRIHHGVQDLPAFAKVGCIHNGSYLGGALGLIAGIVWLWREKRKSERFDVKLLPNPRRAKWLLAIAGAVALTYGLWSPGADFRDGRHNLGTNAMWLQHGWLGDETWFRLNNRGRAKFRHPDRIRELAETLRRNAISHVFPHLCPCNLDGKLAGADFAQTERFLDEMEPNIRVIPWIGGVRDVHCRPGDPVWRARFVTSSVALLEAHPRLAGVHVNIEPMPSGDPDFVTLLRELKDALPEGKELGVAAYPPPTMWHRFPEVHWDQTYVREISGIADHLAVMMYDTALKLKKPYRRLMADWTGEVLNWAPDSRIWLGVPAYDDAGAGYHDPRVENLDNALRGIHAGLARFAKLPPNYAGIAIYCEWEMDDAEWRLLDERFLHPAAENRQTRPKIPTNP